MSRFEGAWDCADEAPPPQLWRQALKRALASRRGQAMLREVESALLALPQHELAYENIVELGEWDEEGDHQIPTGSVCVIGAVAVHRDVKAGATRDAALLDLAESWGGEHDCWETEELGVSLGMARTLAWKLACLNDETFGHLTPPERWEAMLAWVRERLLEQETRGVGSGIDPMRERRPS
jgi:hypothetical protein